MGSFQVCYALGILFRIEKLHVEHLEVSSFCQEKMANCKFFSKLLIENFSSRIWKNSPTKSAKASASMVGGLFTVATVSCWGKRSTKIGTKSGLLGTFHDVQWQLERWWQWLWHKLDWGSRWHPKSLENVARRHLMPHSAHNRPIVWMQMLRCN